MLASVYQNERQYRRRNKPITEEYKYRENSIAAGREIDGIIKPACVTD